MEDSPPLSAYEVWRVHVKPRPTPVSGHGSMLHKPEMGKSGEIDWGTFPLREMRIRLHDVLHLNDKNLGLPALTTSLSLIYHALLIHFFAGCLDSGTGLSHSFDAWTELFRSHILDC